MKHTGDIASLARQPSDEPNPGLANGVYADAPNHPLNAPPNVPSRIKARFKSRPSSFAGDRKAAQFARNLIENERPAIPAAAQKLFQSDNSPTESK